MINQATPSHPSARLFQLYNPSIEDGGDEYDDYTFKKYDDETVILSYSAPHWMDEVDIDEVDEAVLDRLHLKKEWIVDMCCDG